MGKISVGEGWCWVEGWGGLGGWGVLVVVEEENMSERLEKDE